MYFFYFADKERELLVMNLNTTISLLTKARPTTKDPSKNWKTNKFRTCPSLTLEIFGRCLHFALYTCLHKLGKNLPYN
jgi:hypothetical protein